jgi:hypothetical protein
VAGAKGVAKFAKTLYRLLNTSEKPCVDVVRLVLGDGRELLRDLKAESDAKSPTGI